MILVDNFTNALPTKPFKNIMKNGAQQSKKKRKQKPKKFKKIKKKYKKYNINWESMGYVIDDCYII